MGPEIDILPYLILPAAGFLGMYSGAYWGGGCSWLLIPVLLFLGCSPMEAAGIALLQMAIAAAVPVVRQSPSIGWGKGSVGRGLLLPVAVACALFTLLGVTVNSWTYHKLGGVFFNVIFALFMLALCINSAPGARKRCAAKPAWALSGPPISLTSRALSPTSSSPSRSRPRSTPSRSSP